MGFSKSRRVWVPMGNTGVCLRRNFPPLWVSAFIAISFRTEAHLPPVSDHDLRFLNKTTTTNISSLQIFLLQKTGHTCHTNNYFYPRSHRGCPTQQTKRRRLTCCGRWIHSLPGRRSRMRQTGLTALHWLSSQRPASAVLSGSVSQRSPGHGTSLCTAERTGLP